MGATSDNIQGGCAAAAQTSGMAPAVGLSADAVASAGLPAAGEALAGTAGAAPVAGATETAAADATSLTLGYYDANAQQFAEATANVEFYSMQQAFACLLPPGGKVLDLGCGSGRDAKYFLDAGFDVTATDGSAELCRIAARRIGRPVRHELFQDLHDIKAYDGIWACSSILHLPKPQLAYVLGKIAAALKPNGVVYTSFKHGDFEGMRNGRYFTNFTEPAFRAFLAGVSGLRVERAWTTADVRPGRGNEKWLNLLLRA